MKFVIASILTCSAVGFAAIGGGVVSPGLVSSQEGAQSPSEPEGIPQGHWEQVSALKAEARNHLKQLEYVQAIEKSTQVLNQGRANNSNPYDFNTANADVFLLRGKAFLGKGFPLIALDDFNDAVDFADDETLPVALVERARVSSELKRYSRAISDCSRAIRLKPDFGQAYLVRSRALAAMGKFELAQRSLNEADRLGVRTTFKVPLKVSAVEQARDLLQQGSAGLAREVLSQALLKGNNNWQVNGLLALAQYQLNEFYPAITASSRALNENPAFAEGYKIRGLSHLKRRGYDAAVIDFKSAMELDPGLTEELEPFLQEARQFGGIDPAVRMKVLQEIKSILAQANEILPVASENEKWLLELNGMSNSTEQVAHLQAFLEENADSSVESLNWLADFLMLNRQVPSVKALRSYLQREQQEGEQLTDLEQGLKAAITSKSAASANGVNLFADAVSYAVFYDYQHMLKALVDAGTCHLQLQHVADAIAHNNSHSLRILLPNVLLSNRAVKSLLAQAIDAQKVDFVQIMIDRYNDQLTTEVIEFLGVEE